MEGRQEGILDDTQELTTENMPENQPGDQPEAELMGQPEKRRKIRLRMNRNKNPKYRRTAGMRRRQKTTKHLPW